MVQTTNSNYERQLTADQRKTAREEVIAAFSLDLRALVDQIEVERCAQGSIKPETAERIHKLRGWAEHLFGNSGKGLLAGRSQPLD